MHPACHGGAASFKRSVDKPTTCQQVIDHCADVRVICMGGSCLCMRMSHSLTGEIDYRAVRHKTSISDEWIAPPDGLCDKLDALRSALGIDFFCADFVVPSGGGEPVFLELNPGGQFLYLDQKAPGMAIASRFCSLLVNGDAGGYEEFVDRAGGADRERAGDDQTGKGVAWA